MDSTLDADAARALIFPLYEGRLLRTGEPFADHAEGVAQIVRSIGGDPDLLAAAYLFGAHDVLRDSEDWVRSRAGAAVDAHGCSCAQKSCAAGRASALKSPSRRMKYTLVPSAENRGSASLAESKVIFFSSPPSLGIR